MNPFQEGIRLEAPTHLRPAGELGIHPFADKTGNLRPEMLQLALQNLPASAVFLPGDILHTTRRPGYNIREAISKLK
ncbi:hypothetical protein D3C72_1781630 [compost metagenome]